MDTKKLQNIVIIILALLNIFLLFAVLSDTVQKHRAEKETEESLVRLLADNSIVVDSTDKLVQSALPVCTVVRSLEQEQEKLRALIGKASPEDLGGSILFYRSAGGQAVLRGTGEMELLMGEKSVQEKRSAARACADYFKKAGIAVDVDSARIEESGMGPTVTMLCMWNGYPVYNAGMVFDFSEDTLYMVTGIRVFDVETSSVSEGVMDSVSALMRFVEIVKNEGFICSRLTGVSAGYLMNVTVSGESTLTPVWHIGTDTGDLYINAVNGRAESIDT